MRHLVKGRKFGLKKGPRKAFLRNLMGQLIQHEEILTTEARAKELRGLVERMITHGKKQTVASLRLLMSRLPKAAAYKVYHDLAPRYADRKGGYTKVIKESKVRVHDAAKMARIKLV